mmetsp:Transcript_34847/g.82928  ORF Transcript_34847/g.82928 Transcript_34847/m.82928 type:complete len:296 (-) Transcript_34847:137-1024(-)
MSASEDAPLPPGWSKHYSNTWKKNYWFNSKTGKQSWEPPAPEAKEEANVSQVGEKRKLEDEGKKQEPEKKQEKVQSSPVKAKPAKAAKPPEKPSGGSTLDSLLGSIGTVSATQSKAVLEAKRRRKEAEEAKRNEEKAERDNYTQWVQGAIETFLEGGEDVYEFPPSDSVHRLIVKDEAEEKGLVAFSHGEDEAEKRVYMFRQEKAPNALEQRYLHMGGTIEGLMERRARGDTFKEYNTVFSLKDAKLATAKPRVKADQAGDAEDEIESRVVQERNADASLVGEIAQKIRENRSLA